MNEKDIEYSDTTLMVDSFMDDRLMDGTPVADKRIQLNVGGKVFECYSNTLKRFPESILSNLDEKSKAFHSESNGYFFDRNPVVFDAILEACRTGELHMPRDICNSTLQRELEFWNISPSYLSPCCWKSFYRANNDMKKIFDLTQYYRDNTNLCLLLNNVRSIRENAWLFLDEPRSSIYAKIWAGFMALVVVIALFALSWETTGYNRVDTRTKEQKETIDYFIEIRGQINSTDKDIVDLYKKIHPGFEITFITCFALIALELLLRLIACPCLWRYLKSPIHLCEIIASINFWLFLYTTHHLEDFKSMAGYVFFTVTRLLIILQVFHLVRIANHSNTFKVMSLSVSSSLSEIAVLCALLLIFVSMFGWLMYIVEVDNDRFDSFFTAMYWALITLTTVGYGDYYPATGFGHVVAGACAVAGLVTLALPIGVIAASFSSYYSHHKYVSHHMQTYRPYKLETWRRFTEKMIQK